MQREGRLRCETGWYKLVGDESGHFSKQDLHAGDEVELLLGGRWVPVRLERGCYNGWYYRTPDGQAARLAICMRVR